MRKPLQIDMLQKAQAAYGGVLRNTRKGRQGPRALSTKYSMHLVARSSYAKGAWNFRRHDAKIKNIVKKFTHRYGVRLISLANAGNHLHFQIQLTNRHTYKQFIRALTGAIVMAVTGASRWNKALQGKKFWDYRPFTRIVKGYKAFLTLKDYLEINRLEGRGYDRSQARFLVEWNRNAPEDPFSGSA